ncbi:Putative E3 ubiquitin-protein ligase LIN [Seminavis robusta]|uniref:E3 ubiquitin-protein ligase LIN n=1 Tax=Seminavis robusta TaxID=568900 RepID=A0A9N8I051_9STRA|nr:Putative E3 ubiquitin-protein ligase LIN [Seminavis robusta]|eukprot:Sro2517_g330000.1 Putative E3 ubiquitin-protein ligase LIN (139) ;mRNA; f:1059-1475
MGHSSATSTATPPEHFVCPLTLEVMEDPVRHTATGHSFERKAILKWFWSGHASCPLTRLPLHPSELVSNDALSQEIEVWRQLTRIVKRRSSRESSSSSKRDENHDQQANVDRLLSMRNRVLERRAQKMQAHMSLLKRG